MVKPKSVGDIMTARSFFNTQYTWSSSAWSYFKYKIEKKIQNWKIQQPSSDSFRPFQSKPFQPITRQDGDLA